METVEHKNLRKERKRRRKLVRNEIVDTVRDWWEAWFSGDVASVAALACDRFVEFAGDGEAVVVGKNALMEQAQQTASVNVSEWDILDPEVKVFEDAAVCRYCFQLTGSRERRPVTIGGLARDVLVKSEGGWRVVAHHGSFTTALKTSSYRSTERFRCVSLAGGEACEVTPRPRTLERRTPGTIQEPSQEPLNVVVTGRSDGST